MPSNTAGGGPYTIKCVSANAVKDNGATVMWGGNVPSDSKVVTNVIGRTTVGFHPFYGSNVGTISGFNKPSSATPFNVMTVGKYVVIRMCTQLNSVANTILNFGAGEFVKVQNAFYRTTVRTRRLVLTGGWNYVTGRPIAATDAIDTINGETFPSRSTPGRIVFMQGPKLARTTSYSARTT